MKSYKETMIETINAFVNSKSFEDKVRTAIAENVKASLQELIKKYGLPLLVKKDWWYGDYYFRAEEVESYGMVKGVIIKDGEKYKAEKMSQDTIVVLKKILSIKNAKAVVTQSPKVDQPINLESLPNPNKLDINKTHYAKGITKLFIRNENVIKTVIFDRFEERDGKTLIYVIKEGETKPQFYPFPQTTYLHTNKDDLRSQIDKENRQIGIMLVDEIVSAFEKRPTAKRPSKVLEEERQYEKDYHNKVDTKLKSELQEQYRIKELAQDGLDGNDKELRQEMIDARENGTRPSDSVFIAHKVRKERYENLISVSDLKIRHQGQLIERPYFARLDCGKSMGDLHTVYLGQEDIGDAVVSWKNPRYGNAYYQSNLIKDRTDIVLALKRIIDINNGVFKGYKDEITLYNDENIKTSEKKVVVEGKTDELLNRLLLESRNDKRVHDIIKTIQNEQYEIITSDFKTNAVVNGCAGSGKTMIMYHRLSYMAYNYQYQLGRDFNANATYVISPSIFFDASINELLRELSIDSIHQAPYEIFIDKLLDLYCVKNGIIPFFGLANDLHAHGSVPVDFYSTKEYESFIQQVESVDVTDLEYKKWVLSVANKFLSTQGFESIEFEKLPQDEYKLDNFFDTDNYYKNKIFLKSKEGKDDSQQNDTVRKEYYRKGIVTGVSLANINEALSKTHGTKVSAKEKRVAKLNKNMNVLRCCLSLKEGAYDTSVFLAMNEFWRLLDKPTVFEKMISIIIAEKLLASLVKSTKDSGNYILKCLYTFINKYSAQESQAVKLFILRFFAEKFGSIINEDALVFIDEFQNYSAFELDSIKKAYKSPVFNLFGDFDQCIEQKGLDLDSKLKTILNKPDTYNINVNYRNAKEITEYINKRVHKNMQSIGISGKVLETALAECDFNTSNRTAIICKDVKLVSSVLKHFIEKKQLNDVTHTSVLSQDKFNLMSVSDCKGLEFDTVYVLDFGMTDNEKYVAYTRALDSLVVISDDLELIQNAKEKQKLEQKESEKEKSNNEVIQIETKNIDDEEKNLDQFDDVSKKNDIYLSCLDVCNKSFDIIELTEAIIALGTIVDYKDSQQLIVQAKNKIAKLVNNANEVKTN